MLRCPFSLYIKSEWAIEICLHIQLNSYCQVVFNEGIFWLRAVKGNISFATETQQFDKFPTKVLTQLPLLTGHDEFQTVHSLVLVNWLLLLLFVCSVSVCMLCSVFIESSVWVVFKSEDNVYIFLMYYCSSVIICSVKNCDVIYNVIHFFKFCRIKTLCVLYKGINTNIARLNLKIIILIISYSTPENSKLDI